MDQMLFQEALNKNVDGLLKEVEANPSMLHAVALEGGDNPLHMVCLAGHLNFAATIVKLMPGFTRELNQDGFSPLHIAASCGHIEIVKELLQYDPDLCLLEGKNRKIPLHLAVAKGNVEVANLLLSGNESIECTTTQGENALHLAVKYNQFKVFQVLIQHLMQVNKQDLLNSKDSNGNTILHNAVYKRQYQVVELLLNGLVTTKETMELNTLNKSGLTPLDMLLMFQSEAGDRELHEILIQSGALKAENLQPPAYNTQERPNHHDTRLEHPKSRYQKLYNYFRFDSLNGIPNDVRNTLLVVVILVTAATYQPILSPPGGTWQDNYVPSTVNNTSSSATNNTNNTKPHIAGEHISLTNEPLFYSTFIFINSMGFYSSLIMIQILTETFPLNWGIFILIGTLSASYFSGLGGLIRVSTVASRFVFYSVAFITVLHVSFMLAFTVIVNRGLRYASSNTSEERV